MQFIKELVEEMADGGSDPNLTQPPTAPIHPPTAPIHPPTHDDKDAGQNPKNGPEVVGPPTFQQLLASL